MLVQILLLSGGTPHANFDDLAHAWGRDRGFHKLIITNVCERRGEVERKHRRDLARAGGNPKPPSKPRKRARAAEEPTVVAASVADSIQAGLAAAAATAAQQPTTFPMDSSYHPDVEV